MERRGSGGPEPTHLLEDDLHVDAAGDRAVAHEHVGRRRLHVELAPRLLPDVGRGRARRLPQARVAVLARGAAPRQRAHALAARAHARRRAGLGEPPAGLRGLGARARQPATRPATRAVVVVEAERGRHGAAEARALRVGRAAPPDEPGARQLDEHALCGRPDRPDAAVDRLGDDGVARPRHRPRRDRHLGASSAARSIVDAAGRTARTARRLGRARRALEVGDEHGGERRDELRRGQDPHRLRGHLGRDSVGDELHRQPLGRRHPVRLEVRLQRAQIHARLGAKPAAAGGHRGERRVGAGRPLEPSADQLDHGARGRDGRPVGLSGEVPRPIRARVVSLDRKADPIAAGGGRPLANVEDAGRVRADRAGRLAQLVGAQTPHRLEPWRRRRRRGGRRIGEAAAIVHLV